MTKRIDYIPINSIEDIDIHKITLRDINKRYIDRKGMRYATRFNLKTRKIEIVRVVKGMQEAELVRRELLRQKQEYELKQVQETQPVRKLPETVPEYLDDEIHPVLGEERALPPETPDYEITTSVLSRKIEQPVINDTGQFYEHQFMEECASDFDKVKERLNGIKNFIKNSRYFENQRSDRFDEILRDLDIECIQRCDGAVNYYKELISYPRQVSYYMSRMNGERKKRTDQCSGEDEKMALVRRWEIQDTFSETYNVIIKITLKLQALLSEISDESLNVLPSLQKQSLLDARAATDFLVQNCEERLAKIEQWKKRYA